MHFSCEICLTAVTKKLAELHACYLLVLSSILKMEAVNSFEMLVNIYRTARSHIAEDSKPRSSIFLFLFPSCSIFSLLPYLFILALFYLFLFILWIGCGVDNRGIGVQLMPGARDLSLLHSVRTGSGADPASYPTDTGANFPGGKSTGASRFDRCVPGKESPAVKPSGLVGSGWVNFCWSSPAQSFLVSRTMTIFFLLTTPSHKTTQQTTLTWSVYLLFI
jgi:hypothetical protein